MSKRTLLFVTTLLVSLLLMTGCGVAQAEYDAVVAERDAAKAEVASLQAQLTSLQTDLSEAQSTLKETETALETAKADYEGFKSDVTSIWTRMGKKINAAAMIFSFWSDAGKVEAGLMSVSDYEKSVADFMVSFGGTLDAVGKPELSQMWKDAFQAAAQNDEKGFGAKFVAVMDSLSELIGKDNDAMDAKLE